MTAQSAGLEQRARELLAAEYERDGVTFVPDCLRHDSQLTLVEQRAIRAIVAALAAPAADGWMPIESAPKDTMILVGPTKRMDMCVARLTERDGWETETPGEWVAIYTPTHWMPLPAAPQAQGEGK